MTSKSWKFMLPGSGEHHLQIEYIATPCQRVFLDDIEISTGHQESFPGPNGSVLRIERFQKSIDWALFVNETRVEDINPNGNGLRNLRDMGEGSYTIATGFDELISPNIDAKFQFRMDGVPQEIMISYKEPAWKIILNNEVIAQKSHTRIESHCKVEFLVMAANEMEAEVPAKLDMTWKSEATRYWSYQLVVGETLVPAIWSKAKAANPSLSMEVVANFSEIPDVCSGTKEGPEEVEDRPTYRFVHRSAEGVWYNEETQSFEARFKDPYSKCIHFLGEFASAEAAKMKLIEAQRIFSSDNDSVTLVMGA